jgi:hypothetical protein
MAALNHITRCVYAHFRQYVITQANTCAILGGKYLSIGTCGRYESGNSCESRAYFDVLWNELSATGTGCHIDLLFCWRTGLR